MVPSDIAVARPRGEEEAKARANAKHSAFTTVIEALAHINSHDRESIVRSVAVFYEVDMDI